MMKNRFLSAFAFVGLVGLTACGGADESSDVILEEPVIEQPAPAPTIEPAPVMTDTMGAMPMDSAAGMGAGSMDTGAAGTTAPTTPQ